MRLRDQVAIGVLRTALALGTYAMFYAGAANWHLLAQPVTVGLAVVAALSIWGRDD